MTTSDGQRFYDWVMSEGGFDTVADAARATTLAHSTIKRWRDSGSRPAPDVIRTVANNLGGGSRMLAGMIAAGYLTEKEAGVSMVSGPPRELTDDELVDEIKSRLRGRRPAAATPPQPDSLDERRRKTQRFTSTPAGRFSTPDDEVDDWGDDEQWAAQRSDEPKGPRPEGLDDGEE